MRVLKVENGYPSWNQYESKRTAVAGVVGEYAYTPNDVVVEDMKMRFVTNSDGYESEIYEDLRTGKFYTSRTALIIGRAGDSNTITVGKTTLIFGLSDKQYHKIVDTMNKAILSVVESIR